MSGTFDSRAFIDCNGRWWWDPDKFVALTSDLYGEFEKPTCEMQVSSVSGDMGCSFEKLEILLTDPPPPVGSLSATFENAEFTATGETTVSSGSISVAFVEPVVTMTAGRGMACVFEPLEINIKEDYNMATMDLTFKEPTLFASGQYTYVYLDLNVKKFECEMGVGLSLQLELEEMTLTGSGTIGIVGNIKAKARPMTALLSGGPPPAIEAVFEPLTMEAYGSVPLVCQLVATMKRAACEMFGTVPLSSALDLRFALARLKLEGDIGPVGSLDLNFIAPRFTAEDRQNLTAELDATMALLDMRATMLIDGPNDLDLVFEEPEFDGWGDDLGVSGAECDLAETLVYGG